jgi:hypothetical protein
MVVVPPSVRSRIVPIVVTVWEAVSRATLSILLAGAASLTIVLPEAASIATLVSMIKTTPASTTVAPSSHSVTASSASKVPTERHWWWWPTASHELAQVIGSLQRTVEFLLDILIVIVHPTAILLLRRITSVYEGKPTIMPWRAEASRSSLLVESTPAKTTSAASLGKLL